MRAIILAGGKGTRLASIVKDSPKPMALIAGKPYLDLLVNHLLATQIITQIILAVSYKAEIIEDHFKNHPQVITINEGHPKGTGGSINYVLKTLNITEDILVLNGDTFNEFQLSEFLSFHKSYQADISLLAREVANVGRFGQLITDDKMQVTQFAEKNNDGAQGLINCGIYLINPKIFNLNSIYPEYFSFEYDLLSNNTNKLKVFAYQGSRYFIDFGIPEDYYKAQEELSIKMKVC
ncbi:sugar phosphate nucleotidyltransferase [Rickettsiales endosymbiont of Stachyamoeba lipophora]|uniref:sugar phosphate nucleotidyltransferase n=1 Tax=Rickettsiales endosymbiont of Stachyamoeba lipophora TaxID=2486578 RepID=UPI000F649E96|nr:sugar phosphate nucleotidyltransferase [Rickettsiales endosymbiont of Stachyamoeba lipophora]AZL15673.1 hypothetical protein EF513_03800 [Rickettsiales endosymbiont of Stachyamoeba lipophora]